MRAARFDELTDRGVAHDYLALYPSGNQVALRGVFVALVLDDHLIPGIRTATDDLVVLDPRGLVTRDGLVIYDPRQVVVGLPEWARDWLREHPEWPRIATEGHVDE